MGDKGPRRYGNPWAALPYGLLVVVVPLGSLALGIWVSWLGWTATSSQHPGPFGVALEGMGLAFMGLVMLIVMASLGLANPRRLARTILVTDTDARFPGGRRWRRVPIGEITNLQVAFQSGRSQAWGLMVWRGHGDHEWISGPGWMSRKPNPRQTALGERAIALFSDLEERQGPNGPLAQQRNGQPHPPLPAFSYFTRFWDPANPDKPLPERPKPTRQRRTHHRHRRLRAVLLLTVGWTTVVIVGGGLISIDGAGSAKHPSALQDAIIAIGSLFMMAAGIFVLVLGIRTWRRRSPPLGPESGSSRL